MTMFFINKTLTEGKAENIYTYLATFPTLGGEVRTAGEVDQDSLIIKATAARINLTEEEAYDLIEEIRDELPINQ